MVWVHGKGTHTTGLYQSFFLLLILFIEGITSGGHGLGMDISNTWRGKLSLVF